MKALCSVELRVSIDVVCFRYSIAVDLSFGQLLIWIAFEPAPLSPPFSRTTIHCPVGSAVCLECHLANLDR